MLYYNSHNMQKSQFYKCNTNCMCLSINIECMPYFQTKALFSTCSTLYSYFPEFKNKTHILRMTENTQKAQQCTSIVLSGKKTHKNCA